MPTLSRHLNTRYGYTCQCWLAIDIADRYFLSRYRTWFSTNLNPLLNGSSSNPLVLYEELNRIVHHNDFNHSRVDQLRRRLISWISGSSLPNHTIALLTAEISSAPVRAFRPILWKIDLSFIHVSRLISLGQFPDEYQINDLIKSEIEVIVS